MKDELSSKSNILQFSSSAFLVICALLGLCVGYLDIPFIADICQIISTIFRIKSFKIYFINNPYSSYCSFITV